MIPPRHTFIPLAALALSACATSRQPAINHTHPASPEAAESSARPMRRSLGSDPATQRTHELLAKRAADAKAAEEEAPTDETNIAPATQKPTGHENHQ